MLRLPDPENGLFHFHCSLHWKLFSFSPYSEWLNREFVATLNECIATGKQFRGILAAHSIATTLKYWYHGSPPGEIVSLGVMSEGKPGLSRLVTVKNLHVCLALLLLCPHLLSLNTTCKLSGFSQFRNCVPCISWLVVEPPSSPNQGSLPEFPQARLISPCLPHSDSSAPLGQKAQHGLPSLRVWLVVGVPSIRVRTPPPPRGRGVAWLFSRLLHGLMHKESCVNSNQCVTLLVKQAF